MRYLITGGAGFIGSHLCEQLLAGGHNVLVLDDLSTGRFENVVGLDGRERFSFILGSVNDADLVTECVRQCDTVMHLASAVGVRLIIDQPVRTIETIVTGTDTVLRTCARYRKPVLITSTSEVYGKSEKLPFNEEDDRIMGATTRRRWSYACAKALDEFLALAHWYEYRLPVVIARLFNTVGPRQTGQYGMVVPRFVQQGLAGEPITVYGDGKQTRCFAHVLDVVETLPKLVQLPAARGQIYNIGSTEEVSMLDLAERVKAATGGRSKIELIPYEKAYVEGFEDMRRRVPDLAKIQKAIGYRPRRGLDQILKDVIADVQAKSVAVR
ncbi:MAG: GDP-mannose 4,6-dehydratase [Terracidiphilus sp.]